MSEHSGAPASRRGQWQLWVLLALFALPVIAAWFLYYHPEYLPATRTNRGELIQPALAWPEEVVLVTPAGTAFDRNVLRGRWTLVTLAPTPCDPRCRARLTDLRQARLALGEDRYSVERLLIGRGPPSAEDQRLAQEFEGLRVALAPPGDWAKLNAAWGGAGADPAQVYILEPQHSELILRYRPDKPSKDVLKDLQRLIKASRNWLNPERSAATL